MYCAFMSSCKCCRSMSFSASRRISAQDVLAVAWEPSFALKWAERLFNECKRSASMDWSMVSKSARCRSRAAWYAPSVERSRATGEIVGSSSRISCTTFSYAAASSASDAAFSASVRRFRRPPMPEASPTAPTPAVSNGRPPTSSETTPVAGSAPALETVPRARLPARPTLPVQPVAAEPVPAAAAPPAPPLPRVSPTLSASGSPPPTSPVSSLT
mmetsp:Transcript_102591/g.289874  ORF Transcript_102591/g.289874 Transcript_102591/m.289874 type:complete len:215 (-) Transcript_102591:1225-1869(-)